METEKDELVHLLHSRVGEHIRHWRWLWRNHKHEYAKLKQHGLLHQPQLAFCGRLRDYDFQAGESFIRTGKIRLNLLGQELIQELLKPSLDERTKSGAIRTVADDQPVKPLLCTVANSTLKLIAEVARTFVMGPSSLLDKKRAITSCVSLIQRQAIEQLSKPIWSWTPLSSPSTWRRCSPSS